MTFSSLLPDPKHEIKPIENTHEAGKNIVRALTDDRCESDQPQDSESGSIEILFNNIASRVRLQDFIPLRYENFNLEIPYPSAEEIDKTYRRTYEHFQNLLSKNIKQPVSSAINETITVGNGRKIRVATKVQDPLQPKMIKTAKKIYVPSNEEESIQPQLYVSSNTTGQEISKKMKNEWRIPSFVSQWKNPKGYAISSRGGRKHGESQEINQGFIDLANALEQADRKARLKLQEKKEAKIRELNRVMKEREQKLNRIAKEVRQNRLASGHNYQRSNSKSLNSRDISEKIKLYQKETTKKKDTVSYDSRLYTKGIVSGKSRLENAYDNPLFVQQDIDSIYRVKYNKSEGNTDDGESIMSNGPVEFTKAERK